MSWDDYNNLKAANNDFEKEADRECLEDNLEAIGIWGLQDPLRETICDSIAKVKIAGITTIMCTGDNIDTATAISINAGIIEEHELDNKYTCMTGEEFRNYVGRII
jgi:Ca2+-transporting ATPase